METTASSGIGQFIPLIILFAIFYFLIIRPQQKHQKEHRAMLDGLAKGDNIVTTGGIMAVVVKPEEDFLKIRINEETIIKLDRAFVSRKVELSEKA